MSPPDVIAVAVTYNPDSTFLDHARATFSQVTHLIIVDNASSADTCTILESLAKENPQNITLISNDHNLGLGAAQNQGIEEALKKNPEWILLLDQDSQPEPHMIAHMLQALEAYVSRECVGLITPQIIERTSGSPYPCLVQDSLVSFERRFPKSEAYIRNLISALASGSLIRVAALRETGLMQEDYFIEYIDWEFCLRLRKADWEILAAPRAKLQHTLGHKRAHKLLNRNVYATHHSIERRFLAARNRVWFLRSCPLSLLWPYLTYALVSGMYEALLILLFEEQKLNKLKAILKGTAKGLTQPTPVAPAGK